MAVTLWHRVTQQDIATAGQPGVFARDFHHFVPAGRTNDQADVPAPDIERLGDGSQRGFRRLTVHRPRGDRDNERVPAPSSDGRPRGTGLDADG